jgi:hypothetical protein
MIPTLPIPGHLALRTTCTLDLVVLQAVAPGL